MIEVTNLTKDYGTVVAVREISFSVGKGEIVGFLGPNGAGKSTTLRVLAGFLGATSGRVLIAGHDIAEAPLAARRALGYMPESAPLYPELRVSEYLLFRARLKEVSRSKQKSAIGAAMERAGVTHMAGTVIGHLSKGYRQRVALADALVSDPPLLILDEPTAGLDPNQIREVRALIKDLGGERTVLLSTHILSEVQASCERAIVIDRGRLVAEGSIDELRARQNSSALSVRVRDPRSGAEAAISRVSGLSLRSVSAEPDAVGRRTLQLALAEGLDPETAIEALVRALTEASIGIHALIPEQASLEQVFSELTAHEKSAANPTEPGGGT
ncbi:MAG TPA: ABC transporter ATP-binding protein [Polyangiaceae bacterium]|nr:ABC transporter ATP-binding protein [Polyangiaceae bacterium]